MESVTADLRVTNLNVKPMVYLVDGKEELGESVELRASGHWVNVSKGDTKEAYPMSLHLTVYPGHEVIPALGDNIQVTVQRQ